MFFRILLCLFVPCSVFAGGSLSGRVADSAGTGIPQVEILLSGNHQTVTDEDGRFGFPDLSAGAYTLKAKAPYYLSSSRTSLKVAEKKETTVDVVLKPQPHTEVTLTVTGRSRATAEVSQAVDVLGEEVLDQNRGVSLGDALANRPGISSTAFGPTAGRPIIRGMSGDRIRVLEGGLGTGDVSTTSVDHVVSVDTAGLNRVEILRGAASLRYGGAAVGGVVNLMDDRIPTPSLDGRVHGALEMEFDTVMERRGGRLRVQGGHGPWAWRADTTSVSTEDYTIPGPAERFPDPDEVQQDILTDSAMDLLKSGVGFSYTTDRGSFGLAYTDYQNEYGVPGHEHHHHHKREDDHDHHDDHGHDDHQGVRIDLEQRRIDLKSELMVNHGLFRQLRFNLAGTDYAHVEAEGEGIGTRFSNDYLEGRLEASLAGPGFFDQGDLGVHFSHRDFAAVGEEAFVQPNTTRGLGAFLTLEKTGNNWNATVGARYDRAQNEGSVLESDHDHHDHDHKDAGDPVSEETEADFYRRTFNGFSGAVGMVLGSHSTYGLAANLTYTGRAPTAESLFASGAHIATSSFEIGDPNLVKEESHGLDMKLFRQKGRITGEISLFYVDFENYIFERFTGEEVDGLRETAFTQADSRSYGGEARVEVALLSEGAHRLNLRLTSDQVRSHLDDGTPLPRITPRRHGAALDWGFERFQAHAEVQHVAAQHRVAPLETTGPGHTLAHLSAGWRLQQGTSGHLFLLQVRNLTDEEARVHTSFLKDKILQPGRNFSMLYRLQF